GSPLIAPAEGSAVRAQTSFIVARIMQSGETTLFATGRYHDHVVLDDGEARFFEKIVILDNRVIDTLLAIPLYPHPLPEPPAASLTRHRSFVLFWCARTFTNGAYMMQGVAAGWQIYELTNDPFDLGLVGLVQFVPLVALSVVIGQVADRFDRRIVVATCQVGKALAALALAIGTARGSLTRDAMLAIL